MGTDRFVHLTRAWSNVLSRRGLAGGLGLAALAFSGLAEAKKKHQRRRKRKKNKQVTFNEFGCVNVGNLCKTREQCCSGICDGKQGKKKCQAHDTGGCLAGEDDCAEESVCPENPPNPLARCYRTTGNASVCGIGTAGACMACTKDSDCEAGFGPGAACVVCGSCPGESHTSCVPTAL